ncbi:MAG: tetratricopeptide repeat protein [Neisseriaceae bacterium]
MNLNVLILLIAPLFFALGWIAGRIDMKTVIRQAKQLPKRVYDGIDALIENRTGIASENIRDTVENEPQLTELQLSLGKLYRHRGENDIAIKTHTKLLNSQFILNNEEKDKVRLELAKDFQQAGLVDRAESILLQLINSDLYSHKARELLLNIYQQDKNWKDAIDTAKTLATSDYIYHTEVAQFNCELAQEALIKSNISQSLEYINNALEINRKCVRANVLLGEYYYSQENYLEAIKTWQLIEKQNYLYLPMVIEKIFDAYIRSNQIKEGLTLLKGYITLYPKLNLCDVIFSKLIVFENPSTVLEYLRTTIKNNPNSKSASLLIDLHSNTTELSTDFKPDAEIIKNLLLNYNARLARYRCGRCNFKGQTFFWQCPACYEWESVHPFSVEA